MAVVPTKVEPARDLWIAVPAYTGDITSETMRSLDFAQKHAMRSGVVCALDLLPGCCYLDLARSHMVDRFLDSDFSDMLFVDADVAVPIEAIAQIAACTKPVVCGIYPKKIDVPSWPVELPAGENWTDAEGCLEITHAPTGFLRIHRSVFAAMRESAPEVANVYKPGEFMRMYFQCVIRDRLYWGEDFEFCNRWRALGGKLWALPDLNFGHVGKKCWSGVWGDALKARIGEAA